MRVARVRTEGLPAARWWNNSGQASTVPGGDSGQWQRATIFLAQEAPLRYDARHTRMGCRKTEGGAMSDGVVLRLDHIVLRLGVEVCQQRPRGGWNHGHLIVLAGKLLDRVQRVE